MYTYHTDIATSVYVCIYVCQGWKWVGWPGLSGSLGSLFWRVKWVSSTNYIIWMWPGFLIDYMFFRKRHWHLIKWVNLGSGECTEPSLVGNQLPTLCCFEAFVIQRFYSQEFCVCLCGTSSLSWRNLWHCFISDLFHVILHNF